MNLPEIVKMNLLSLGARERDSFLVALSGGADSTALLLALQAAVDSSEHVTAAHLDHGVRPGSKRDRDQVIDLCRKLGINLVTGYIDPDELEFHRLRYGSLEAGMRQLRYRFLIRSAQDRGSDWILTGHTLDDQAETVLFRVGRGMDWRSFGAMPGRRGMILRPLIEVPRSSTEGYCKKMGISPVVDPSNYDEAHARNRIRNRILPGLAAAFNPGISDLLCRMGQAAGRLSLAEQKLLTSIVPGYAGKGACAGDRDLMHGLPEFLRKRVILDYLFHTIGVYPSRNLVQDVLEFVLAGSNGRLSLPGDMVLDLSYGQLHTGMKGSLPEGVLPSEGLELKVPGSLIIPSAGIRITAVKSRLKAPGNFPSGKSALIARKSVPGSLWVRKRRSGDRFMPLGMDRDKKLKDFLLDRKVPRSIRDQVPIVMNSVGEILWVGGVEISRKAALAGVAGEEAILIRMEGVILDDPPLREKGDQKEGDQG